MKLSEIKQIHLKGFIVFSTHITYSDEDGKKFQIPKGYNTFTKENTFIDNEWNSFMMRMGIEYEPKKYIILIDVDNHPNEKGVENGLDLWDIWNIKTSTISEITPSGGYHYYFYVDEEQQKQLTGSGTKIEYDNVRYAVDYKFTNQSSVITPSHYNRNGEDKAYKFVKHSFIDGTIEKLPDIIFDTIKLTPLNKKFKNVTSRTVKVDDEFITSCKVKDIQKLLPFIGKVDDWERWRNMSYILKNLNQRSFNLFDEWSQKGTKYNKDSVIRCWNSHKPNNGITIEALFHFVREDKLEGYESILAADTSDTLLFESKKIETRYLTNSEFVKAEVKDWMNNYKFLSILSPYDTGKTTLIENILSKYKCERVLYITYRQSLARAFHAKFKAFANYLDGDFMANKQIIQLDSIYKLTEQPYDLVIIDEIESVLAHLTAGTIKNKHYGNANDIFDKLSEIVSDSKHVLSLDGDYNNRSHFFLSSFGDNVNVIENTIKFNKKDFYEFDEKDKFNVSIFDKLDSNKKIVLVCMSAEDANKYYQLITKKYLKKDIKIYTSKTNDNDKKDVSNIASGWLVDVLIYSPAIESGVDFNIEHFDNLFIVYSQLSTCPRGLNQMMNRVRQFKDKSVNILFERKINSPFACSTFDELTANYRVITQKKDMSIFDMIYCFNIEEKLISDKNFYGKFLQMIRKKGHGYHYALKEKTKAKPEEKYVSSKMELIDAEIIDNDTFNTLIQKQKKNEATHEDKILIEKHIYMSKFGVTDIDEEFLDDFYHKLYIFDNHLNIIDIRNVKNYEHKDTGNDYDTLKEIKQCECIHNIIKTLGFSHCYDKKKLDTLPLEEALKIVTQYNQLRNEKVKPIKQTTKAMMGAINTILHEYGCGISSYKTSAMINGEKANKNYYKIGPIKNIDICVQSRVNNGLHIKDANKLIKIECLDE